MSWLSPKHLEDASRVVRGAALVLASMASDSKLARRAAVRDYQKALQYVAEVLQQQADAAAAAAPPSGAAQPGPSAAHAPHAGNVGAADAASASSNSATPSGSHAAAPELSYGFAASGLFKEQQHAAGASAMQAHAGAHAQAPAHEQAHATPSGAPSAAFTASAASPVGDAARRDAGASHSAPLESAAATHRTAQEDAALPTGVTSASVSKRAASATAGAATAPVDAATATNRLAGDAGSWPSVHDDVVVAAIDRASREEAQQQRQETQVYGTVPTAAVAAPAHASASVAALEQPATADGAMGSGTLTATASGAAATSNGTASSSSSGAPVQGRKLRERRVPESPLGRALGFAGMGASLFLGNIGDNIGRLVMGSGTTMDRAAAASGRSSGSSNFLTEANAERLADALCRMRGAALKIGQMLSIQDESVLPPQVQAALERVRASADVMPRRQLEGVLSSELGPEWQAKLAEFDWEPKAAASIGQVHSAVLKDGRRVAMKIQYPGVARSIESDVDNLMRLISIANVLPRGMYVENAVRVAKRELALECDYTYELGCQRRFKQLIEADPQLSPHFHVPGVVEELSSQRILTTEWVKGVPIDKVREMDQPVRDAVGTRLLQLTLRELFEWHFMQTDPNWGNFLYDPNSGVLNLIDFGASKDYPAPFVTDYMRMVAACAERDRQGVIDMSVKLGFLTGDEAEVMLEAHTQAGFVVGMPFAKPGLYDFGSHGGMTARVSELGAVMLKHRLTPPPEEAYSLHRKLSGAFLACMKLKAQVPCRDLLYATYNAKLGPFVPPRLNDAERRAPAEGAAAGTSAAPRRAAAGTASEAVAAA